jgi:hypothetical protein
MPGRLKCKNCSALRSISIISESNSRLLPSRRKLLRSYQKYREALFVFLHRTDVEPTNNLSERNLRPSVIHRKIIGCFRSGWGARTYAALASVIDTAALNGAPPFDAIQNLFDPPALPLPAGA